MDHCPISSPADADHGSGLRGLTGEWRAVCVIEALSGYQAGEHIAVSQPSGAQHLS